MTDWGFDKNRPDQRFWQHITNNALAIVSSYLDLQSMGIATPAFPNQSEKLKGLDQNIVNVVESAYAQHSPYVDRIRPLCEGALKPIGYDSIDALERDMLDTLSHTGVKAVTLSQSTQGGLGDISAALKPSGPGRRGG